MDNSQRMAHKMCISWQTSVCANSLLNEAWWIVKRMMFTVLIQILTSSMSS